MKGFMCLYLWEYLVQDRDLRASNEQYLLWLDGKHVHNLHIVPWWQTKAWSFDILSILIW